MKKLLALLCLCLITFASVACGNSNSEARNSSKPVNETPKNDAVDTKKKKTLIVYYSRTGNTEEVAKQINQKIGGDMMRIQTVTPYPSDYNATTTQAKQELESGFKPQLQPININVQDYDTIFIGSPCWWGTIAPPMMTFLSEHDLKGKTIVPFNTHGGTGIGRTVSDIKKFAPDANVLDGLSVRGNDAKNAQTEITNWLQRLSLL